MSAMARANSRLYTGSIGDQASALTSYTRRRLAIDGVELAGEETLEAQESFIFTGLRLSGGLRITPPESSMMVDPCCEPAVARSGVSPSPSIRLARRVDPQLCGCP